MEVKLVVIAAHKALSKEVVVEAIESWILLNIMQLDHMATMVKFLVPFFLPGKEEPHQIY